MEFKERLTGIKKATKTQRLEECWDIEGMIKGHSNQVLKFDTRPIKKFALNQYGKVGYFKSKADKMVFDTPDQWVIIDVPEMSKYIKDKGIKDVYLGDLISNLDWNIMLQKF